MQTTSLIVFFVHIWGLLCQFGPLEQLSPLHLRSESKRDKKLKQCVRLQPKVSFHLLYLMNSICHRDQWQNLINEYIV